MFEEGTVELFDEINDFLKQQKPELLTEEEVEALIISLALTRGEEGFSEDECVSVIRWAESVRVGTTMLDMVLDGSCAVNWSNGDVTIQITDRGKERYETANG